MENSDAQVSISAIEELPGPLVVVLNEDGCIEQINSSLSTLLEYQPHELMGENWFALCLPPEGRAADEAMFRQMLAGRASSATSRVSRIQSRSGRQYNFAWHIEPIFNKDQRTDTILTSQYTTGQRSMDHETLLQSLAQKQAVLDNAVEAIINIDTNGLITDVNKATEKIFGYASEELLGENIRRLMSKSDRSRHDGYIKRFLETGEKRIIGTVREVTGLTKTGSEVLCELRVTEINVNGKLSFTGVIRDITNIRAAEVKLRNETAELMLTRERLAHMDRLHIATEMSTGLAHELNQPLSAIAMYTQASKQQLESDAPDTQLLLDTLSRIDAQTQRAGNIIRGLHGLINKHTTERRPVDINVLITSTVELAKTGHNMRQIDIACSLSSARPTISVVYSQIQQVLLNLINNARDALIDSKTVDKRIVIGSSADAIKLTVTVSDNGDGVSSHRARKIFEPFYSTKDPHQGMGMGLAISRSLIGLHGGVLELNPQYTSGAEFFFTLPINPPTGD